MKSEEMIMKKLIVLLICLTLLLCACGGEKPQEPTNAPTTEATPAPTAAATEEATQAPTEEATEQTEQDLKALAESCIDLSVEELYALIGEPESAEYAPSCIGDGEDGNLYYDGFTVFTYKEGDTETVTFVE